MQHFSLRQLWTELKKEQVFVWTFNLTIIILGVCILSLFLIWNKLPPQIPLYYSLSWGEEQLGTPIQLLEIFGSLIFFNLADFIIAAVFVKTYQYYARLMLIGSFIINCLFIYSLVKIVLLIL